VFDDAWGIRGMPVACSNIEPVTAFVDQHTPVIRDLGSLLPRDENGLVPGGCEKRAG